MTGFFSSEELDNRTQIDFDFDSGPNCLRCGLYRQCHSPKMQYTGEGKKNVLIIAEAPGATEDQRGIQLIGNAGQFLRLELSGLGLDLDSDFWKVNAVNCRPTTSSGANRPPTKSEIKHCKPLVDKTINDLKPSMIWLMGGKSVESFYMNRFKELSINRWRKLCIPDRKTGAWVIPLFHPSYIQRQSHDDNLKAVFLRDLKWAASCIGKKPFEFTDERTDVVCLYDFEQITKILKLILRYAESNHLFIYKDYETNGLKPQWPGSKIATVSFCVKSTVLPELKASNSQEVSIAFPFQYADFFDRKQQNTLKFLLRKIMTHSNISFRAHNMKFEDAWDHEILGVQCDWNWDTMIAAHILDNRSKFTGLKFQSYIHFGLEPYNKEVDRYLKAASGHFNKVDKAPLDQLLLYNGIDTLVGERLYKIQQKQFGLSTKLSPKNRLGEAYSLFHEGILTLADVQRNGIHIDEDYYRNEDEKIAKRIIKLKDKLATSKEAQKYKETKGKDLDVNSPQELGVLFYDVLGLPAQLTEKDNYRVDEDALESIKLPFVKDLLQLRKLEKAQGTYFAQILREVCKGRIYPFYDLHIPRSYRSSSSMPNWQNIPIRDPEIGKLIRSGIYPTKGNKIAELDYSSIEVRMAAVVTGDPNLTNYVLDPTTDMHRDAAMDLWMLPENEITKDIRKNSKSDFVFAVFYGSYYRSCAIALWKHNNYKITSGITLKQHMKDQGITSLEQFTEHCKKAEDIFWGVRFRRYAEWKEEINELYRKQGYIDNHFGFRFSGYMNSKQVSNFPIQSVAFQTLLHSLILINNTAKKEGWRTKIIGQIHDSILLDLHPLEEEYVIKTCIDIMSNQMRQLHDWVTVPIPVEAEVAETNRPWFEKKEKEFQL